MEKIHGVYNIEGIINKSQILIKQVGKETLKPTETIGDNIIEKFDIMNGIHGEIYICNILDSYLISSKVQPIFYINVIYSRPLRHVLLLKLMLNFTIESGIKSKEEFLESPLNGKYNLGIIVNNKKSLLEHIITYPGKNEILQKMKNFILNNEIKTSIINLKEQTDTEWAKMYPEKYDDYDEIPKPSILLKDYESDSD
jgi:hypothetical protein